MDEKALAYDWPSAMFSGPADDPLGLDAFTNSSAFKRMQKRILELENIARAGNEVEQQAAREYSAVEKELRSMPGILSIAAITFSAAMLATVVILGIFIRRRFLEMAAENIQIRANIGRADLPMKHLGNTDHPLDTALENVKN